MIPIVLASASPRRRKILHQIGLEFETAVPLVEETVRPGDPAGMVKANALCKWRWCVERYPHAAIIAADTTVELEGCGLGKPASREGAFSMLRAASGRMQTVYTGYVLAMPGDRSPTPASETSRVFFRHLDDAIINAYLDAVQPLDRAGAYDIDDHGEWIIQRCEGSRTNVMGLPAERVKEWIECRLAR